MIKIKNSWVFDKSVSINFDEHVRRSIIDYDKLQKRIAKISEFFLKKNALIYDLGCSTGNSLIEILNLKLNLNLEYIGIDIGSEMIKLAKAKLYKYRNKKMKIKFIKKNIFDYKFKKKSNLIISVLLTPFFSVKEKDNFYKICYDNLNEGGALILLDKNIEPNGYIQQIFNNLYYDDKYNLGISREEISKKERSLRSSMDLETVEKTVERIRKNKFKSISKFYKYYNFNGLIALK